MLIAGCQAYMRINSEKRQKVRFRNAMRHVIESQSFDGLVLLRDDSMPDDLAVLLPTNQILAGIEVAELFTP